ncbi:F-box protein PP2-B1-like [Spinacia oleracea]|uniref:F-box protein PP2-B1-like n=1 Tax=Spinacia oleracea TaxID=3562 RepID=A0A9R0HXT2_SPIOL|nr:F-box protein PP2-B1-like [Spinacia oleracea]
MLKMKNKKNKKRETKLLDLPEGCLSQILSLTTPSCVLRCSLVCKLLYSIANSDFVWKKLVPSDLHPLVERSSSTSPPTKHLVLLLCRSFIILEDGHMSFSLNEWTGKKSYMIGARRLTFASGDMFGFWRGILPKPKSRFSEVAELIGVNELHITGRISTQLLSPNTTYRMYFSFMLEAASHGFDVYPVRVFVSRIDKNGSYLGGSSYNDASKTFYLKPRRPMHADMYGHVTHVESEDTMDCDISNRWMMIDMGKYFNQVDDNVDVLEMTLMGTEIGLRKSGLVVQGIEILPVD